MTQYGNNMGSFSILQPRELSRCFYDLCMCKGPIEVPDRARMDVHLEKTSRTFALPTALLGEPLREEITVSYLLLRIADCFEDATRWSAERKITVLNHLAEALLRDDEALVVSITAICRECPPLDNRAYLDLIQDLGHLLHSLRRFDPFIKASIVYHVSRMIQGMAYFVTAQADAAGPALKNAQSLRSYCYCVAGIVGELYTDLAMQHYRPLTRHIFELQTLALHVGEALQLTNILKDEKIDQEEGRRYIPLDISLIALANRIREGYESARRYIDLFLDVDTPVSYMAFVAFPILIAMENLRAIESGNPGRKVDRTIVYAVMNEVQAKLSVHLNPLEPIQNV